MIFTMTALKIIWYFTLLQLVAMLTQRTCYYECPMEGTMVDLTKYPSVSNKTVQLEKYVSMSCPTTKRAHNLKWLLATKEELLYDGETRLTNDSRYEIYDNYLAVSRADVEHKGVYVCMTKFGKALRAIVLDVRDDPPQMYRTFENETATLGGTAHLSCNGWNVRYETMKHMNWTFNGQFISVEGQSLVEPRFNFWSWSLTIRDVTVEDKGAYHCYINTGYNILGKVSYLDVYTPPKVYFTTPSKYHANEVTEGSNLALSCKSRSHPVASIRWTTSSYHDAHCREHIETITTGCSLGETMLIKNFTRDCISSYRCEARNEIYTYGGSEAGETFFLSVAYAPEVTLRQDVVTALVGEVVTITCHSSSRPYSKATWWKDDMLLADSDKYHVTEKPPLFFLTIYNIQQSDQETYKCQTENYVGIGSDSVTLTVTPNPGDTLDREVEKSPSCENIHLPVCQNLWYNSTKTFPSILHPEVTSQADLQFILYSQAPLYNPTDRCAKFISVHCMRHMPPCLSPHRIDEVVLPCQKLCETARFECPNYSYQCDDLPSIPPCVTHQEIATLDITVDPPELDVYFSNPVTIRCRVKTNARLYLLFFGINDQHTILHNRNYVTVTRADAAGVYVLEAKYNAFHNRDIKQFVCVLKTEAFDTQKFIPVKVSDNFQITLLPARTNYVNLGEDKKFSCKVYSSCNISSTFWAKYGSNSPLQPSGNVNLTTQTIDANTVLMEMSISNLTQEDIGGLECVATNECGKTERLYLHVSVAIAPDVVARSSMVSEVIGGEAALECSYRKKIYPNPNVNILWKKGLEVISRDRKIPGFMPFNSELIVLNVTKERLGNYMCFARNQFGWSYQQVTVKEIPGKPPVVKMSFDVQGKQVVLDCTIYAQTDVSLTWYKGRRKLVPTNNKRRKYVFSEMSSSLVKGYELSRFAEKTYTEYKGKLTVKRFSPDDLDVYDCVGSNNFGNRSSKQNLTAYLGPPKVYKSYSRNVKASVGENAHLYCYIMYDFRHTSTWKRDGVILENTDHYRIRSESKRKRTTFYLDIMQVTPGDFGDYQCMAENKFGKSRHTVRLTEK